MHHLFYLSDTTKALISKSICNGLGDDYSDYLLMMSSPTNNAGPFAKWDLISKQVKEVFEGRNCDISIAKRGCWKLPIIYDYENKSVLTMMRSERFEQLAKKGTKNSTHYLTALSELNDDYKSERSQLSFVDSESDAQIIELRIKIRDDLLKQIGDVSFYGVILFSENQRIVTSIRYCIVNSNMDIIYEESLNEYISIDFGVTSTLERNFNNTEQVNEMSRPSLVKKKVKKEKAE